MDNQRYIYFDTYDFTGTKTTSSYTLPITPFKFVPVFDDGFGDRFSNNHILWDFGDGTTSRSISAEHYYQTAGWYNVTCYVLGENGVGHKSSFSQLLLVKDFLSDSLSLVGQNALNEAGKAQNPFVVYRFNSWQSYPSVSADGYTINLNALSTMAPLYNQEDYDNDKWSHLKPASKFLIDEIDTESGLKVKKVIDKIQTDNTEVYVKYDSTINDLKFCDKTENGSCFVGTSGSKIFYFVDDIPYQVNDSVATIASTIILTFDTTSFKDKDNFNKAYIKNQFNVLNTIQDVNFFNRVFEQLNPYNITITSNGIDDNNDNILTDNFKISDQKFVNQKIPFVIRVRDRDNFPSKYNKVLTLRNDVQYYFQLSACEVKVKVLSNGLEVPSNYYTINSNFGTLSSEKFGGYFKGYIQFNVPVENAVIYAETVPVKKERFLVPSDVAFISEPASSKLHKIVVQTSNEDPPQVNGLNDSIIDLNDINPSEVPTISGVYTSSINSTRNVNGSYTKELWLADADNDLVLRYSTDGNTLKFKDYYNLRNYFNIQNASPSNIANNSYGDAYVALYDSLSVIRFDYSSNSSNPKSILEGITPQININSQLLSCVQPGSIDVDRFDNLTISYVNPLCSFVAKYKFNQTSNKQTLIKNVYAPSNFYFTEIISNGDGDIFGILKDNYTTDSTLSARNDKIFSMNLSGNNFATYPVSGSLGNLCIDRFSNVWATLNVNEILFFNKIDKSIKKFKTQTYSDKSKYNTISDFQGIACSNENVIYVIDNYNKKLHYLNATDGFLLSSTNTDDYIIENIDLVNITPFKNSDKHDYINSYGDWNGYKGIFKYNHIFVDKPVITGSSAEFTVYNLDDKKYDIRKVNENFDAGSQIKSYIHQEYLLEKNVLFDDFISTIVGTVSSDPNALGKRIYERISNFVDNNANIDTCRMQSLISMYEMLDESLYSFNSRTNYAPANLQNLLDLFTIKYSLLRGSRNKEAINFDKKGYYDNEFVKYGKNLGEEINFSNGIISAGTPIVAYEKFSETYKFIDTNIRANLSEYNLTVSNSLTTYKLSSYSENWGWNLVLPDNFLKTSIPNYYKFYKYILKYDDDQTEGMINWQDPYNTINESISSISDWDNIRYEMINYTLIKGLSLIK